MMEMSFQLLHQSLATLSPIYSRHYGKQGRKTFSKGSHLSTLGMTVIEIIQHGAKPQKFPYRQMAKLELPFQKRTAYRACPQNHRGNPCHLPIIQSQRLPTPDRRRRHQSPLRKECRLSTSQKIYQLDHVWLSLTMTITSLERQL